MSKKKTVLVPKTKRKVTHHIVKGFLLEDIEKLTDDEIAVLYKYVRTHMIANIPNLPDPLEHLKPLRSRLNNATHKLVIIDETTP